MVERTSPEIELKLYGTTIAVETRLSDGSTLTIYPLRTKGSLKRCIRRAGKKLRRYERKIQKAKDLISDENE